MRKKLTIGDKHSGLLLVQSTRKTYPNTRSKKAFVCECVHCNEDIIVDAYSLKNRTVDGCGCKGFSNQPGRPIMGLTHTMPAHRALLLKPWRQQ